MLKPNKSKVSKNNSIICGYDIESVIDKKDGTNKPYCICFKVGN